MPPWVWLSLVFLLLVTVAGGITTTMGTLHAWRSLRSLGRVVASLEETLRGLAAAEHRLQRAGEAAARLDAAVTRLRETQRRAAVLAAALSSVRASVARARAMVPRP